MTAFMQCLYASNKCPPLLHSSGMLLSTARAKQWRTTTSLITQCDRPKERRLRSNLSKITTRKRITGAAWPWPEWEVKSQFTDRRPVSLPPDLPLWKESEASSSGRDPTTETEAAKAVLGGALGRVALLLEERSGETKEGLQVPHVQADATAGGLTGLPTGGGKSAARKARLRLDSTELLDRGPSDDTSSSSEGEDATWLPAAPLGGRPRAVHNAAALAFLGDSIYELYARRHFLTPPQTVEKYCRRVTAVVCCEAQDSLLCALLKSDFLTPDERAVVRWGKNVSSGNRKAKGRAGNLVYASASALETLIGYLYLTDSARLDEVMGEMGFACNSASLLPGGSLPL